MSGKLGKILTNGTIQKVATIPSNLTYASINILVSNPLAVIADTEVWISDATSPSTVDFIEPKAHIPAEGKLEIYARLVSPGENIFVRGPAGLAVRVESADELLPQ